FGFYTDIFGLNRGFCYRNGHFQHVSYPEAFDTSAWGINDHGVIVGQFRTADGNTQSFATRRQHYMTLAFPGAQNTILLHVNDFGVMAGYYYDSNTVPHGFVRTP